MLWDVMRLLWGCYLSFLLIGCGSNVGLKSSRWVVMVQQTGWHSTLQCVKFIYPVEGRRGRRWRRCIEDSRANWNWIAYEVNPNSKMLKGVKVIWRGSGGYFVTTQIIYLVGYLLSFLFIGLKYYWSSYSSSSPLSSPAPGRVVPVPWLVVTYDKVKIK